MLHRWDVIMDFALTGARKPEEIYRLLKQESEGAVRDEQEAIDKYAKIITDAERGGCRDIVNEVRGIQSQEKTHKGQFQRTITDIDRKITDLKRQIEDEQRKLADEQRREEQDKKDRLNHARITEIRRRGWVLNGSS